MSEESQHSDVPQIAIAIFFIFFSLTLGGLLNEVSKKIKIPYPAMVFLGGIAIGSQFNHIHQHLFHSSIQLAYTLKAHTLMSLFIPVLVFYSAFTTDIYIMKKQILQIITLSIPSLVISAILIAIALKWFLEYSDDYYSWGFAFVFGTVVSCTDTFQVVKLLNNAEAPKKFVSLVQGESLVNNCASMIMMLMAVKCARQECELLSVEISYGLSVFAGGVIVGIIFGIFTVWWIRRINHNAILTINLTFVSAYLTYFIAENIDVGFKQNGLVAVISLGLFMSAFSKIRIRTDCEHPLDIFWKYITFSCETIIFLITGIVSGYRIYGSHSPYITEHDYIKVLLLYFCVLGAKLASVLILLPIVNTVGSSVKFSEAILFTYSGARGAVQLILAMVVFQEPSFSDQWSDILLFHTTGIVIFTLIINGSTTGIYVRMTGLSGSVQGKARVKLNFLQEMKDQIEIKLNQMKLESNHKNVLVDWDKVVYFSGLDEANNQIQTRDAKLQKRVQVEEKAKIKSQQGSIEMKFQKLLQSKQAQDQLEEEEDLDEDSIIETRDRFLMALKQTYWDLYSQNQCGGKAYSLLIESVRWDLDTVGQRMCSWDFLYNLFYSPLYMRFLYWLIKLPFIGKYAGTLLFDWISMGYEVLSTYVKAHEEMENMIEAFPIPQLLQRILSKESSENRTNAEHFIEAYLQVSFPEIIKLIQTKKAAQSCLASQNKYIERKYQLGEIDFQENQKLKLQLNNFVCHVEDIRPLWLKIGIHDKLRSIPIFQEFDDNLLKQISTQAKELVFDKDECITREGDLARYVYIITRGRAIETSQNTYNNYTCNRDVNSIISPHHIALQATIYLTQTMADSLVEVIQLEIEIIIKLFKQSKLIQQIIWNESLYALTRFYVKELQPLYQLEKNTITKLMDYVIFQKHKSNQLLQVQACILLHGKIREEDPVKKDEPHLEFDANLKESKFGPLLLPYRQEQHKLITESVCTFFMFDQSKKDEILKLIAQERSMEKAKSKFLPDHFRSSQSNVNRQSFGFSYLMRPSKLEHQDSVQYSKQAL